MRRVYCASPYHRAKMWRVVWHVISTFDKRHTIISTWHDNTTLDDNSKADCREGWKRDLEEIRSANLLLAYAERGDKPNGTLVEIGYALSHNIPIALVGNFAWGTWQHLPNVRHYPTFREFLDGIGVPYDDPT